MKFLFLYRHGRYSEHDGNLNSEGINQAHTAANDVSNFFNSDFCSECGSGRNLGIYSTGVSRTNEFADIIYKKLGDAVTLRYSPYTDINRGNNGADEFFEYLGLNFKHLLGGVFVGHRPQLHAILEEYQKNRNFKLFPNTKEPEFDFGEGCLLHLDKKYILNSNHDYTNFRYPKG
jgi:phosphohistidine phosphatase SixA